MFVSNDSILIAPYGGKLVDLTVPIEAFDELKAYASGLPSIQISPRFVCDLELLATGALSPLDRFMVREDYQRVLDEMRLVSGHIFPIPVTLPVEASPDLHLDWDIALRNNENELLAVLTIDEIYQWDRNEFADKIFGTRDQRNSLVAELQSWGPLNVSGRLQVLHLPEHYDFQDLRLSPALTRARLAGLGRQNVAAFQPLNALHRLDIAQLERTIEDVDGTLLVQPAVGLARLGDVNHYTRIRLCRALVERYFKPDQVLLSLLPLAPRLAGSRETLLQALISRNYGASHVIASRNASRNASRIASRIHDGPGRRSENGSYDSAHEDRELVGIYSLELGVEIIPEWKKDEGITGESEGWQAASISNTPAAESSNNGWTSPGWSIEREVAEILAEAYPPRDRQGVCIWFTGLSGAGKSTTAEILTWLLLEHGRRVTVLDGDVVRTHLSKGLGFSKEDRDTNVRRIGFVASELVRLGGVVICAVVSPYRAARNDVRNMVGEDQFVEVFVDTPLEVCEARDVKGMYARARSGGLHGFTGIDDPYEPPEHPEITLDTVNFTPQENAKSILGYLIEQGFVRARNEPRHP